MSACVRYWWFIAALCLSCAENGYLIGASDDSSAGANSQSGDAGAPAQPADDAGAGGRSGKPTDGEAGAAGEGFAGMGQVDDGLSCQVDHGGCSPDAECTTVDGAASCKCKFGWTGDGKVCANDGPTCKGEPGSCVVFKPSGGLTTLDLDGEHLLPFSLPTADDSELPARVTVLDSDTGEMLSEGEVLRPASTGDTSVRDVQSGIGYRQTDTNIGVVTFRSLVVPSGATLRVVGTRAIAIASASTLAVNGVVDVRAWSKNGEELCEGIAPGAFAGGSVGSYSPGKGGMIAPAGIGKGPGGGAAGSVAGGGGGHAAAGGASCVSDPQVCNAGGAAYDAADLDKDKFHGGSGGGGGQVKAPICTGGKGGNGGGAIRLTAASSIEISAATGRAGVNASGCGGGRAAEGSSTFCSGGGGGAGGSIVIESPRVELKANSVLNAAGGGGGSDSRSGDTPELDAFRSGGCFVPMFMNQTDKSGNGGFADMIAGTPGSNGICAGGGATGWIRINSGGGSPAISGGTISPSQLSGATTFGTTVSSATL